MVTPLTSLKQYFKHTPRSQLYRSVLVGTKCNVDEEVVECGEEDIGFRVATTADHPWFLAFDRSANTRYAAQRVRCCRIDRCRRTLPLCDFKTRKMPYQQHEARNQGTGPCSACCGTVRVLIERNRELRCSKANCLYPGNHNIVPIIFRFPSFPPPLSTAAPDRSNSMEDWTLF